MAEFAHLHVASAYSLRYGTATPAALATRAADLGMPALALTDRDGLYGAFKHVQACAEAGIKPLLGVDLGLRDGGGSRVTLLATGRRGWASLCRLVSAAHASAAPAAGPVPANTVPANTVRGDGDIAPAVTRELIAEHADGLVLLLGPASDVGRAVAARRYDLARRTLDRWRRLGVDNVVEIVDHQGRKETFRAARLAELARDSRTPAVLSNAVRYLDPVDSLTAQVLDAARGLVPLGSPTLAPHNGRAYLAGADDMAAVAARVAATMTGPGTASAADLLLGETAELTRKCTLDPGRDLGVGRHHLPEAARDVRCQYEELRDRCDQAVRAGRYRTADAGSRPQGVSRTQAAQNARDRLAQELDVIAQTGMAGYFLTVADVAMRIKQAGIRCAIRGSGAGSFINHLLGISAIDPLEHDLLMERFLTPVRNTLPDIDLDVESARRLDAYRIIFDAYGAERTACVCMMETYRARSAIRDVAAAMSLPPDEIGAIAKAFPHIRAKHITSALSELPELRRSRLSGGQLSTVFNIAQQLDGLPRHVAMHPCGVLLSDRTLLDRTAVQSSGEGFPLSQLDKDDAEIAGVIKLDVLGVRMQSAMAHTLAEISRVTGEKIDIDAMPRDDPDTYAMIQRSETIGCFQIESPGQRELVKKLAPGDVADLIVDISLFRPGPVNSDMIGPFLRARHGLAQPSYPHSKLADVLRETGGVVVFHEQVLRIIDAVTGCGLAEADLVRRYLSSDGGPERTAAWFRARSLARGFDPETVSRIWAVVAAFGGFGFCKAHAAAFAIPVYQSAWLRRHHPAAFYAGVLTHDPGMYPKRVIVADARLAGVRVLPVDVNSSAGPWRVSGGSSRPAIRCALSEVKGISGAEVNRVVAGQPYTSLRDFWNRAGVSRPVAERLVLLGAFDSLYAPAPSRCPPNLRVQPDSPVQSPPALGATSLTDRSDIRSSKSRRPAVSSLASSVAAASTRPSRRDLLARVGVLARQSVSVRRQGAPVPDLFGSTGAGVADAEEADGMADLVPAGELRDLDLAERVEAELEILGFEVSGHVMDFYADLLAGLGVIRSADLAGQENGTTVLVAGAKVATQTPAVRSGQRIIFASLDDAAGLVDLAFFSSVQDRCAARLFGSWLLLVRGKVRRAGAGPATGRPAAGRPVAEGAIVSGARQPHTFPGDAPAPPMAVTVNGYECWDLPALEEIRVARGLAAVRAAMAAGDVGPGTVAGTVVATAAGADLDVAGQAGPRDLADAPGASARPLVFANGFTLSPYAETGAPGGSIKKPPRPLWHASPGSPN
jgi:error-prone DNA polymerase